MAVGDSVSPPSSCRCLLRTGLLCCRLVVLSELFLLFDSAFLVVSPSSSLERDERIVEVDEWRLVRCLTSDSFSSDLFAFRQTELDRRRPFRFSLDQLISVEVFAAFPCSSSGEPFTIPAQILSEPYLCRLILEDLLSPLGVKGIWIPESMLPRLVCFLRPAGGVGDIIGCFVLVGDSVPGKGDRIGTHKAARRFPPRKGDGDDVRRLLRLDGELPGRPKVIVGLG